MICIEKGSTVAGGRGAWSRRKEAGEENFAPNLLKHYAKKWSISKMRQFVGVLFGPTYGIDYEAEQTSKQVTAKSASSSSFTAASTLRNQNEIENKVEKKETSE